MTAKLVLYDLAPSPNNMKARIAMNYKEIPFEKIPVDPRDRTKVLEVSGQPLTPVLVHGETVIFDSGGILRYLESNFPKTPRLFSSDYATMGKIESFESHGRREIDEPVGIVFNQFFAETKDPGALARASKLMQEATKTLEERLSKSPWLVGDSMTAADVTCAPSVYYAMLSPDMAKRSPLHTFFAEGLKLGEGRDKTREWVGRVMAYDR